jgi:2-amino-4-hydroxy-6-hydroxymethyldihydropteridine diphosphokinase
MDIDILMMGTQCVQSPDLTIPHYDFTNRDFVLIPLLELNPLLVDPVSGKSLKEMLCDIPGEKRTYPLRLYQPD